MSAKEDVQDCIVKIDKILAEDFITVPVREILTGIKSTLNSAKKKL